MKMKNCGKMPSQLLLLRTYSMRLWRFPIIAFYADVHLKLIILGQGFFCIAGKRAFSHKKMSPSVQTFPGKIGCEHRMSKVEKFLHIHEINWDLLFLSFTGTKELAGDHTNRGRSENQNGVPSPLKCRRLLMI